MTRSVLAAAVTVSSLAAVGLVLAPLPAASADLPGLRLEAPGLVTPAGPAPAMTPSPQVSPTHVGLAGRPSVPGVVLVAPAVGADPDDLSDTTRALGARAVDRIPGTATRIIELPAGVSVEQAMRRYGRDPAVAYAEPDYLVTPSSSHTPVTSDDPSYSRLWGLHNTGQTGGTEDADIDAPEAWATTIGSAETVVAVIDEGVQIAHPDLRENVWTNPGEVPANGIDDDANGYVDDVHGWDFYNDDPTVYDGTDDDHGTHVAGTIAASGGNGLGVTGVAWRTQVMPLKFLGPDGGSVSDAAAALDYAVRNGATISNNSWGGSGYSRTLRDAIVRAGDAGHLFVAAAGNEGADLESAPEYPASFDLPSVVTVAATDDQDRLASFSNYGDISVDLAAPGVGILSTLPPGTYGTYSGTSMATPHVTGVAALLLAAEPTLSVSELRARLLDSVDPVPSLAGRVVSGGRLNAARALPLVEVPETGVPETEVPVTEPTETVVPETEPAHVVVGATPHTVSPTTAASVSGQATRAGAGLAGETVQIEQRPVGSSEWTAGTRQLTDSAGAFSFTDVRPAGHTDYRVTLIDTVPVSSEPVRVSVQALVTLVGSQERLAFGRARTLRGTVQPTHADSVRIAVRRNGELVHTISRPLVDSSYRWRYRPPARGRYTFRAVWLADLDHLGARSPKLRFRVR